MLRKQKTDLRKQVLKARFQNAWSDWFVNLQPEELKQRLDYMRELHDARTAEVARIKLRLEDLYSTLVEDLKRPMDYSEELGKDSMNEAIRRLEDIQATILELENDCKRCESEAEKDILRCCLMEDERNQDRVVGDTRKGLSDGGAKQTTQSTPSESFESKQCMNTRPSTTEFQAASESVADNR
ncbi:hypothetical protein A7U60_g666 [Sanghuangporus baumii]|uniref:Uncharacterized protein n=1 Tax=Sanghuangporus baumii TaxID=108892 RepID=A0A9Q5NC88_SANBA|nr:hypothetical protein A7U60_g666 [Sanghuangporus baumii]